MTHPLFSDLQNLAPESQPTPETVLSPDSHEAPSSPMLPFGPEYARPNDVPETAPIETRPESKADEPLIQVPGDAPEVDDDFESDLDHGDRFNSETEDNQFVEITDGNTTPHPDDGSLQPSPVQFTSFEAPLSTISLREVPASDVLSNVLESTQAEGPTSGHVDGARSFQSNSADYLLRSEVSLTSTHYFEAHSNNSLSLEPLLSSHESTRSHRRFRPPTAGNQATISIEAIAAQSRRTKTTAAEASPEGLTVQNEDAFHGEDSSEDFWDAASEVIMDLALMAIVGEFESSTSSNSMQVLADMHHAKSAFTANTNRTQVAAMREDSFLPNKSEAETTMNDFARNFGRFAVLGFILSKGISVKAFRLPPPSTEELAFSKDKHNRFA
jgi:hypothetical protein